MDFAGSSVLVMGLARSGEAVARLLQKLGARVTVNDAKPKEALAAAENLEADGIKVVAGDHPLTLLDECDLIVKNPGIPYDRPLLVEATARGIPIVTEVEIAYAVTKSPIIGITGSNGKTTTTSLVGYIFEKAGRPAIVAGNIGTPLAAVAYDSDPAEWIIAELSSFQLQGTSAFRPHIAALLNLYPAHLDYHGSMSAYIAAKSHIFANQQSTDIAILSLDHAQVADLSTWIPATVWWISVKEIVPRGVYLRDGIIYYAPGGQGEDPIAIIPIDDMLLRGMHNVENALAACAVSLAAGISISAIADGLREFGGVVHRLEFVREKDGVRYVNDSKATNPQAAIRAIESFSEPLIGILGGLDRGDDLTPLISPVKRHMKAVLTIGQSGSRMQEVAKMAEITQIYAVSSIEEAVLLSHRLAEKGDVVLLSPAAASWDMFTSFEERGDIFKQAVHML